MSDGNLSEDQFGPYVEHGESPLFPGAKRVSIVDPGAPVTQRETHRSEGAITNDYWSPEIHQVNGQRGPLKKPRVYPNPNVTNPNTVAFADYHPGYRGEDNNTFIHYVTTRPDQAGHGHARRLVEEIAAQQPNDSIDFGRIMHPAIGKLKDDLAARGRQVYFKNNPR